MIKFACFSPHPLLLLPSIGEPRDKEKVRKTIENLRFLGENLRTINPDKIIISSPHLDWGFNVPLHFLSPKFEGEKETLLTKLEPPFFYFEKGKETYAQLEKDKNYALIGSGDTSHYLKKEGTYGFHSDGPKFDKALIYYLKKKNIKKLLMLNEYFPQAGECGLRSFAFILGILEASEIIWQPKILSYENPFGIGYLVVDFSLN